MSADSIKDLCFGIVGAQVKLAQAAYDARQPEIDRLRAENERLRAALKDWLAYAEECLSEFDLGPCEETENLCPRCRPAGCIKLKIANARAALAKHTRTAEGEQLSHHD